MLVIAGLVIMGVGTLLVFVGVVFSWAEYRGAKTLGASDFVKAIADLVRAIAGQPRSVICFAFGTVLIFLGGIVAGVGGLSA
ncbi:hypothetical protein J5X84_41230 [Streptosporangiaceae bacterium NEAU-GS5]|nr:hypothetical protein [Streptosporangiaceae bacterium NEAU-GS5]